MRATVVASLAFFGIAAAQDLGQLPTCAVSEAPVPAHVVAVRKEQSRGGPARLQSTVNIMADQSELADDMPDQVYRRW